MTRRSGSVVIALGAAMFAVLGSTLWLTATHMSLRAALEFGLDVIFALAFVLVGAILLWKRSAGSIAWLLVGCGASIALTSAVNAYVDIALGASLGQLPADPRFALLGNPISVVALGFGLVLLPLLFPDGSPLSARWRLVVRVAIVAMVASVLTGPFAETDLRIYPEGKLVALGANPFAAWPGAGLLRFVAGVAFVTLLLLVPVAFASLVHRYWRGTLDERVQIRWVVAAAGTFVATLAFLLGSEFIFGLELPELFWDVLLSSAVSLTPVAIGVAILRYGLYDLDRIVSRTVSYTALTLVLAGVYVSGVMGLGALVRTTTGGSGGAPVVAASTFVVAALFGPLRRRLQVLVDRRFNRARYDALYAVEALRARLRDEIDLDELHRALAATVAETVAPVSVGLWLARSDS